MVQQIKNESQKQKEMQLIEFEVQTKNKVDVAEVEKLQQNLSKVQQEIARQAKEHQLTLQK